MERRGFEDVNVNADTNNMNEAMASENDGNMDSLNQAAIQNLIHSIVGRQPPTSTPSSQSEEDRTLHLAQRILSSSIGDELGMSSISGSSSRAKKVSSLFKKVERSYRKHRMDDDGNDNNNNKEEKVQRKMEEVRGLYDQLYRKGGEELATNVLALFSRLANTNAGNVTNTGSKPGSGGAGRRNFNIRTNDTIDDDYCAPQPQQQQKQQQPMRSRKSLALAIYNEEMTILRECIHSLQSIDGEVIRFYRGGDGNNNDESISIEEEFACTDKTMERYQGIRIRSGLLPLHLNAVDRAEFKSSRLIHGSGGDALRICGEAGFLYSRIISYIEYVTGTESGSMMPTTTSSGVVTRALASALMQEMQSYHALLTSLEQQLYGTNSSGARLTLRRLMTQLRGPICQLRTLALIVDGAIAATDTGSGSSKSKSKTKTKTGDTYYGGMKGGQLLTMLYLHSMHGDMRHQDVSNRILYQASLPWYDLLYDWTMSGTLTIKGQRYGGSRRASSRNPYGRQTMGNGSGNGGEFFVMEDASINEANLWHGRYVLDETQIPHMPELGVRGGLLSEVLAREILVVGKGINFIRKCLHDSEWELDLRDMIPRRLLDELEAQGGMLQNDEMARRVKVHLGFHYDPEHHGSSSSMDICGKSGVIMTQTTLERTVSIASSQVHKHILSSLFGQHHLLEHLRGLKEILFLGQGAFISTLMDGLHEEFESRESLDEIHMIALLNVVQGSLKSTNAKFLPQFVTDRVQVRLLPINDDDDNDDDDDTPSFWTDEHSDCAKDGWDIFSLGYAVDAPLTAVVHVEAMEKYHLFFNLLFRLKRIEWMMNNTWRQSTVLNHSLQIMVSKYGTVELGPSSSVTRDNTLSRMKRLLRKFSMTRQSMLHFITNLQSYLMFEVLESGWNNLVHKLRKAKSLDEVILSHNEYLDEILAKGLFGGQQQRQGEMNIDQIERQVRMVLTATFRFCKIHERIFSKALDTIGKAGEKRRGAERRTKAGKWGFESFDPDVEGHNFYNLADEGRLEEVESISEEFDISLRNLLSMLANKINGNVVRDVDVSSPSPSRAPVPVEADRMLASNNDSLRFLTFRLDFSGFYGQ